MEIQRHVVHVFRCLVCGCLAARGLHAIAPRDTFGGSLAVLRVRFHQHVDRLPRTAGLAVAIRVDDDATIGRCTFAHRSPVAHLFVGKPFFYHCKFTFFTMLEHKFQELVGCRLSAVTLLKGVSHFTLAFRENSQQLFQVRWTTVLALCPLQVFLLARGHRSSVLVFLAIDICQG